MNLKEAREAAGLSRIALSRISGVTATTIADIEDGRNENPSHRTVVRLVRALNGLGLAGITSDDLFPVEVAK
jgi:transcriptional regulator with XRE-family HTH domain